MNFEDWWDSQDTRYQQRNYSDDLRVAFEAGQISMAKQYEVLRMDIWKERIASDKETGKKAAKAERRKWAKVQNSFTAFS